MINFIGAYITLILVVAVLYHRPPVAEYDERLGKHVKLRRLAAGLLALLALDDMFGIAGCSSRLVG